MIIKFTNYNICVKWFPQHQVADNTVGITESNQHMNIEGVA